MDRSNVLEHLLLSRCGRFNGNGEILEFLEQRYSFNGPQKNYLVLESTDGGAIRAENDKKIAKENETVNDFLSNLNSNKKTTNKFNKLKTKNEFKKFIQTSIKHQDNVSKKISKMIKSNPDIRDMEDIIDLKICCKILKIEDYIEMNTLWNNYINELIKGCKTIDTITAKLSSAEYIGAYFTVTHCSCSDSIGIEGIVLWESQSYILMIIARKNNWKDNISIGKNDSNNKIKIKYSAREMIGGLRMIPKKKTRFTFRIDIENDENKHEGDKEVINFEFIGDRLCIKSLDRANKKFKSHNVKDIDI